MRQEERERIERRRARRRKRMEIKRSSLRIALGKVRRRGLYYLPPTSSCFNNIFICFVCDLNV